MPVKGHHNPHFNVGSIYLKYRNKMSKKSIAKSQIKRIEEISLFIKNWRINENMTQRDFSRAAEIHVNTIQKLEAGYNVTLLTLFACIDAMDLKLSDFFEGTD